MATGKVLCKLKIVCLLAMGVLSFATNAAEKTMRILRSATTTNDTWVAEIGGLDEGDTLVFDTSDLDVGGGYPVSFGDVTTPRLAGIRVTGHACGLNLSHIAFKLADGAEIDIGTSFRVVIKNTSINAGETTPARIRKKGAGFLQLESTANGALRWTLEDGITMVDSDAAFGIVPSAYEADAIIMSGGVLCTDSFSSGGDLTFSSNRGITVSSGATAVFGLRRQGASMYLPKITGDGNVTLYGSGTSGVYGFTTACDYSGTTVIGGGQSGVIADVVCAADNVLPSSTTIRSSTDYATLDLNGTSQRVAAVNDNGVSASALTVSNGTLSFGLSATTTTVANVSLADGAVLRLAEGALDVTGAAISVTVAAGTELVAGAGADGFAGDVVLEGNATLSASGHLAFGGTVSRATGAPDAVLSVSAAGTFTYGLADNVLRTVTTGTFAALSPAPTVLDGLIWSDIDLSGYAKGSAFVPYGPMANAQTTIDGTAVGYSGTGLDDGAAVTVSNGGSVTISAEGDVAVSRSFTLDATSSLALAGNGRVTMSGTVTGGTVTVADGTEVYVAAGQTLTLASVVNGTLTKTGGGELTISGAGGGTCALVVNEGTVRLGASDAAVANVTVAEGATLALDADEQIANAGKIILYGTLDLNGHAETVDSCGNRRKDLRTDMAAQIVNTSASDSSLVTTGTSYFYGRAVETAGRISLSFVSSGRDRSIIGGAPDAFAVSSITSSYDGLMMYNQHQTFTFRFLRNRSGATSGLKLTEIQLTYGGVPIPQDAYLAAGTTASSTKVGDVMRLFDGCANTGWEPSDNDTNTSVTVMLNRMLPVDGYRFCAGSLSLEPLDWDVYAYRSDYLGTILMDSRRNTHLLVDNDTWTGFINNLSSNFFFSAANRLAEPFGPQTDFTLQTAGRNGLVLASAGPVETGVVSGPGDVLLQAGTTWSPGDISAWTGAVNTQYATNNEGFVTVLLDATRGPAAQRVPLKWPTAKVNFTFGNAGETPAALLADDSTTDILRGRLADVNGPMGLVKRGTGTVTTEMQDASNTGVTAVEAGRLRVQGPRSNGLTVTAHHLRIVPTRVKGGANYMDSYKFNWGMNEFQLLDANGNVVSWPSDKQLTAENDGAGANVLANLIDGKATTRCLVYNIGQSTTSSVLPPVRISSVTGFTFSGYRWYTPHGSSSDANRTPVALKIEISDDGTNWTTVDVRDVPWVDDDGPWGSSTAGLLRGPFVLAGASTGTDTLYTLPSEYFAEATARDSYAPALVARYFRFEPFSTLNPTLNNTAYGWMIGEFSLFRNGARIDWPDGTSNRVTTVGGSFNTNNNSRKGNLANNKTDDPNNGTVAGTLERFFMLMSPSYAQIDAGENVAFDAYGFWSAAAGGYDTRLPTGWRVWISQDGSSWELLDARADMDDELTPAEYTLQGPWNVTRKFPLLNANNGASNALGDESPVAISASATLEIAADYEKFGTLSGAGTLELVNGATAEINAVSGGAQLVAPAAFSGTISGSGTLVVSGVATQAFDNATLTGVQTLELNGGTVVGTASAPGALAVSFGGGTWFGELTAGGALTVTGTPVFGLPTNPGEAFRKTLFTYTSIDAASATALASAAFDPSVVLPKGLKARVTVTGTSCVLTVAADGTIILFR